MFARATSTVLDGFIDYYCPRGENGTKDHLKFHRSVSTYMIPGLKDKTANPLENVTISLDTSL